MQRISTLAILGCALWGCSDESVAGDWQSTQVVVGQRNALSAQVTGEAHATVFIDMMEAGQRVAGRFEFDALWLEDEARSEFDMDCQRTPFEECQSEDDFRMDCRLEEEGATLNCDGDGRWSEYVFSWSRQ